VGCLQKSLDTWLAGRQVRWEGVHVRADQGQAKTGAALGQALFRDSQAGACLTCVGQRSQREVHVLHPAKHMEAPPPKHSLHTVCRGRHRGGHRL